MAADELATAVFTEVILFVVVFFPVSDYVRTMAMGAIDVYDDTHSSYYHLLSSLPFPYSSYFVDHHQSFYVIPYYSEGGAVSLPLSGGAAFTVRPPSASKLRFSATPHPAKARVNGGYI
jgi:hypothetical protein